MAPSDIFGSASPIGATFLDGGVNFSLYSRNASSVDLLLFDHPDSARPSLVIPIDPVRGRTYHYWHAFVPHLVPGQIYGYRVSGNNSTIGDCFDQQKVLLDPYARAVAVPKNYSRDAARLPGDNTAMAMKSVLLDSSRYDWEKDVPLRRPASKTIVYEMHVRGFTRNRNSGVTESKRGTFSGVLEKIEYLKNLGVNAVELLPIFQFDPQEAPRGRTNYWGYAPVAFFAPHSAYSSRADLLGPADEFRDMVKMLHRAGIEVILDVVYNHTAEGGTGGPVISLKGIDNRTYYIPDASGAGYADFTGTGNTLNANHSVVRRMILDSLRYWVGEMHVDGFRFDLASILSRDESGKPLANPPILWEIESDPVLAGTKMIAEAWDAAGLYQVGTFIGDSWKEWNGRFRDDVRSFFRGDNGFGTRVADRLMGSPDIFGHEQREPEQSVNFVTCHDGFTLNDLVSYDRKHNEENGEGNRDGMNDNRSWNCGVEGPTTDPEIERVRNRQVKNFLATTLLSLGMPMIMMGDEVRRTQHGNNNAYCHDAEWNWVDWDLLSQHADIHRFVRLLIERRLLRDSTAEEQRISLMEYLAKAKKAWHGVKLNEPDWRDCSHSIAVTFDLPNDSHVCHFILNAYWEALEFELPPAGSTGATSAWRRWIDTSLESPDDICSWEQGVIVPGKTYSAGPRSVVALVASR